MKRFIPVILALALLFSPCATAERQTRQKLPYALNRIAQSSVFAGDEVIDFILQDDYCSYALVAFRHGDQNVLVGYQQDYGGRWHQYVISETLLPGDGNFSFEYHLHGDKPTLSVIHGDEAVCLMPWFEDTFSWLPYLYHRRTESGGVWQVGLYGLPDDLPWFSLDAKGVCTASGSLAVKLPGDPSLLSFDVMPTSAETSSAPLPAWLTEDGKYCVCSGCNFRILPDVRSASMGYYNPGAVVETLGIRIFNWVMVKIGGETGWMHTDYVHPVDEYLSYTLPCAYSTCAIPLYDRAGEVIAQLPESAEMYVLGSATLKTPKLNCLHVCVPQDGVQCAMEPDGVYGYVSVDDVLVSANALNLRYALEAQTE